MRALLVNQQEAFDRLSHLKVGALFMEPGTGKTQTAYELIRSVGNIDYVLWIAPYRTIHTDNYAESIPAEIEKCGNFECESEFIGIESIQNSDRIFLELMEKVQYFNTFLVCDESIKIKNFESKRTKRLLELSKLCSYRLILTGTPLSRNLLDLWSQFQFLSPKILNMGYEQFKNTFCEWVKITKNCGIYRKVSEYIKDYHNIDYLYSLISPYIYECTLDLDVKSFDQEIGYSIDDEARQEYFRLKHLYLDIDKLQSMNNNIFLEMTQKMQHAYCCSGQKFDLLRDTINKYGAENIIVACKYVDSVEAVSRAFPELKVLSFASHSFGLNLQPYNVTFFWDKTFDYAHLVQLKRRTYRTGQQRDCIYIHLTGNIGLESMINKNINKKQSLLQYFKKVGAETIRQEL